MDSKARGAFTIVCSPMRKNTTSDETIGALELQVADLVRQGWAPVGGIVYYKNAVSQALVLGTIDATKEIDRLQRFGSSEPRELVYIFGGRGANGEKHWYEDCVY